MAGRSKQAVADDLRHVLTVGSVSDPGFLVNRVCAAIADLEGGTTNEVRDALDRIRQDLGREPLA